MKITILASGAGEKALYLYDFFKEGNRITVDSLISAEPDAEIVGKMRDEGIDVFILSPGVNDAGIGELLKSRGVEMLVVDDFGAPIPAELESAYADATVYPTGITSAPLEVITAAKPAPVTPEVTREEASQPKQTAPATAPQPPRTEAEREWAEILGEDTDTTTPTDSNSPSLSDSNSPSLSDSNSPSPSDSNSPSPSDSPAPPPVPNPETAEREKMPDTYLVWSVIATVLCCMVPGVIAIIYSASVSSKYYAGDIEGAQRASRNAQIWIIVSLIAGILWATLYLPLTLLLS